MCRTVQSILQMGICALQMVIRTLMTVLLMFENIVRMLLQTLYNFMSIMLQILSLLPICIVFLLSTKLKCFMCGGGVCPAARSGTCDMVMSFLAFAILFFIFRSTGLLDKIFYNLGYAKAPEMYTSFEPTPGEHTTCSRDTATTTTPHSTTTQYVDYYEVLGGADGEPEKYGPDGRPIGPFGWGPGGWGPHGFRPGGLPPGLRNITFIDDEDYYRDADAKKKKKYPKCKTTSNPYGHRRKFANRKNAVHEDQGKLANTKIATDINDVDELEQEENKGKDISRYMQESQNYIVETSMGALRNDEEIPSTNTKISIDINDVDPLEEEENKVKDVSRDMQESQSYIAETLDAEIRNDEEIPSSIESPIPTYISENIITNTGSDNFKQGRTEVNLIESRPSEARQRVLYYKHGQPPIRIRSSSAAVSYYQEQLINTETSSKVDFDYSTKELNPTNHSNVVYYLM